MKISHTKNKSFAKVKKKEINQLHFPKKGNNNIFKFITFLECRTLDTLTFEFSIFLPQSQ